MRSVIRLSAMAAFALTLYHGAETAAQQIGVAEYVRYRAEQKRNSSAL